VKVQELLDQLSRLDPTAELCIQRETDNGEIEYEHVADEVRIESAWDAPNNHNYDSVVVLRAEGWPVMVDTFCPHGHLNRDDCPVCGL
jgi:hypothetical protein